MPCVSNTVWKAATPRGRKRRAERVANYSDPSPGHYQFHVVAFNEDGVPDENRRRSGHHRGTAILAGELVFALRWLFSFRRIVIAIVRYLSISKIRSANCNCTNNMNWNWHANASRIARVICNGPAWRKISHAKSRTARRIGRRPVTKIRPQKLNLNAQNTMSQTARQTTRALDENGLGGQSVQRHA